MTEIIIFFLKENEIKGIKKVINNENITTTKKIITIRKTTTTRKRH